MTLLERLLAHDAWTTRQLLSLGAQLTDEQLDQRFDIGHRSVRATFEHIIFNMEVWTRLMAGEIAAGETPARSTPPSVADLQKRVDRAATRFADVARRIVEEGREDDTFIDLLDSPPRDKTLGTAIAHLLTHSMHHRAQVLWMLKQLGVTPLPEGDVFSWENTHG